MTERERALRTLMQFVLAGGLTAILNAASPGLGPSTLAVVTGAVLYATTYAQNWLEDRGLVPALLKTPPTPPSAPTQDGL